MKSEKFTGGGRKDPTVSRGVSAKKVGSGDLAAVRENQGKGFGTSPARKVNIF